jgi:hypothetical protein
MEIFGAAIGMLVGLAALGIALWQFPKFRWAVLTDYRGISFATAMLLGGLAGYWMFAGLHQVFARLFHE